MVRHYQVILDLKSLIIRKLSSRLLELVPETFANRRSDDAADDGSGHAFGKPMHVLAMLKAM